MTLHVMRGRIPALALAAIVIGACGLNAATRAPLSEPLPTPDGPPARILFLAEAPEDDARYLSAYNGAEVSLAVASLAGVAMELTWVELPPDPASWMPPDADGAILAPGTSTRTVTELSSVLDVPTVSLAAGPDAGWPVLVADASVLASAMLRTAGSRPCLVPSAPGSDISRYLGASDIRRIRLDRVVEDAWLLATCTGILWAGGSGGAARLEAAMTSSGLDDIEVIGTDAIRFGSQEVVFEGSLLIASAAIDVSTRLDLPSRRFVQDYQSETGLPPGPFSAEAWDAAALLAQVIGGGPWPDTYSGLGGVYDLSQNGVREVYLYRLVRGDWRSITGR